MYIYINIYYHFTMDISPPHPTGEVGGSISFLGLLNLYPLGGGQAGLYHICFFMSRKKYQTAFFGKYGYHCFQNMTVPSAKHIFLFFLKNGSAFCAMHGAIYSWYDPAFCCVYCLYFAICPPVFSGGCGSTLAKYEPVFCTVHAFIFPKTWSCIPRTPQLCFHGKGLCWRSAWFCMSTICRNPEFAQYTGFYLPKQDPTFCANDGSTFREICLHNFAQHMALYFHHMPSFSALCVVAHFWLNDASTLQNMVVQ